MNECPEGYYAVSDAAGNIHCLLSTPGPDLGYVMLAFWGLIALLLVAGYIRRRTRKARPLTVDGWTLNEKGGYWQRDE